MKILHILDHSIPLHSGYAFRTKAILEQQRKLGFETYHLTSAKHTSALAPVETVEGLVFYRTLQQQGLMAKLPVLGQWAIVDSLAQRLDEIIPKIKPDLLHAHSPALNGLAALKAARKHSLPLVYECRAFWEDAAVDHGTTTEGGVRYRLTKWLETRVFKQANAVTTICQGLRSDIISRGLPDAKITVIPNAVDVDKFSVGCVADPVLRQRLGLDGCTVLGFIGSFYAYEGLLLLLEALPKIIAEQPQIRLLLVGGGPQEAALKQRIEALGLASQVKLVGRVPHDQVQAYYNQVDIFVYPRLSMRLTELVTPLKPLEAMAQGRLVVASDVGGHRELIENGHNGRLFQADNAQDLADTVLTLLANPAQWPQLRRAGRQFVEQERNWEKSVGLYHGIYHQLLNP